MIDDSILEHLRVKLRFRNSIRPIYLIMFECVCHGLFHLMMYAAIQPNKFIPTFLWITLDVQATLGIMVEKIILLCS